MWDTQGHIVTNYHVIGAILSTVPKGRRVDEVAKVTMEGSDGKTKTFSATLVGAERSKDLAVLRVNAPEEYVRPVDIGSSAGVKVGQAVFAIGGGDGGPGPYSSSSSSSSSSSVHHSLITRCDHS